ncbi:MAG: hypothetical protein IT428_03285 [Planctomycetaceae bacterium]|nr:hypothetical protein [Planctomycetaceae bacterium]
MWFTGGSNWIAKEKTTAPSDLKLRAFKQKDRFGVSEILEHVLCGWHQSLDGRSMGDACRAGIACFCPQPFHGRMAQRLSRVHAVVIVNPTVRFCLARSSDQSNRLCDGLVLTQLPEKSLSEIAVIFEAEEVLNLDVPKVDMVAAGNLVEVMEEPS